MIISNIYRYIYSCVNVCIYKYVIRPPQTKISGYAPDNKETNLILNKEINKQSTMICNIMHVF